VNHTEIHFILRNFNATELEEQIKIIEQGIDNLGKRHPKAKFKVNITKSYRNMREIIDQYPYIIEIAKQAIEKTGVIVREDPIRGGTDGAQFSYRGMPTPNIFTGGFNFHSKKEFIPVIAMEKAVETIVNIITLTVEKFTH
jgi:tripeptide aminopeptidase